MGEIAPEEQFHPLSTIFYHLVLNFYVNTGIRFSLRDKGLFEITEVEITRVDCIWASRRWKSISKAEYRYYVVIVFILKVYSKEPFESKYP